MNTSKTIESLRVLDLDEARAVEGGMLLGGFEPVVALGIAAYLSYELGKWAKCQAS